jgi:hypothetical protein
MAEKNASASAKAKKQQSIAAATGSQERQPPKGKQNAPATESTEQEPPTRQSPRKHAGSPGSVPRSKRVKTHDTAETATEGKAHPYACVDVDNIEVPDKEGDPTCRGLCHDFFLRLHSPDKKKS